MIKSLNPHIVTTRKPHICFGCGREFTTGSQMNRSGVLDEGSVWTCYLCKTCIDITYEMHYDDEYGFSDLREEALERENKEKGCKLK